MCCPTRSSLPVHSTRENVHYPPWQQAVIDFLHGSSKENQPYQRQRYPKPTPSPLLWQLPPKLELTPHNTGIHSSKSEERRGEGGGGDPAEEVAKGEGVHTLKRCPFSPTAFSRAPTAQEAWEPRIMSIKGRCRWSYTWKEGRRDMGVGLWRVTCGEALLFPPTALSQASPPRRAYTTALAPHPTRPINFSHNTCLDFHACQSRTP